jgi:hypothetical protein
MKNRRWSDNDKHLWPFTLCTSDWRKYGFMLDSGGNDGGPGDCHIRFYCGRFTLICELPRIVRDQVERKYAGWDDATIARIGRNWYDDIHPREYGAYVSEGTLHVHFGAQTHDSSTDQNKCYFLPWRNWRFIRHTFYDLEGGHFWTELDGQRAAWAASSAIKDAVPKAKFEFEDFDGQKIVATTHIEEREWHFGTGLFRWLSLFRKPMVTRTLDMEFSAEVGPEKGSWKGGTCGTSIEMVAGESAESAFKRYCENEHRSKYKKFRVRYLGKAA